jgi:hypothetical protein
MFRILAVAVSASLVGAAVAWAAVALRPSHPRAEIPAAIDAYAEQLAQLRAELESERLARAVLEQQVAALRKDLDAMVSKTVPSAESYELSREQPSEEGAPADEGVSQPTPFDEDALVAAGFAPRRVEALRARLDEIELRRLYLRDRASREGWLDSPRYSEERSQLMQARRDTRGEFGDDLYDWMLFSTGHPNRVRVSGLIEGSAAVEAGIQAGDVIRRYDDQAILSAQDLRRLTTEGSVGATTALDLERNGERIRLYVPRGPLGVRIEMFVDEPTRSG